MNFQLPHELQLPPDFTSLLDVPQESNGTLVNMIGVVVDHMPEMKNRKNGK
jgi:hypothetical protein